MLPEGVDTAGSLNQTYKKKRVPITKNRVSQADGKVEETSDELVDRILSGNIGTKSMRNTHDMSSNVNNLVSNKNTGRKFNPG